MEATEMPSFSTDVALPELGMSFEEAPSEARALLATRIRDLGLKIEGSPVAAYIQQLYEELEARGLHHFRPACYLTDQWGCPSEEPVIGIPFYLADRRLGEIEKAMNDIEDEREIMMYMRHEAGHAFNYAYELYRTEEWRTLFGPFRRAYRDHYKPIPFSKKFVRHIAGWYAQKHPDEDFAETFAVWLTPRSDWRKRYRGWPAMEKLSYVARVASEVGDQVPIRELGEVDFTVEEMESTIEEFYRENTPTEEQTIADLPLDTDLEDIFWASGEESGSAAELIASHRKPITDHVAYWTGVRRSLVKAIVEAIHGRVEELGLTVNAEREAAVVVEVTAYVTTLAMNYLTRGKLVHV
jgi:hypothetical protein